MKITTKPIDVLPYSISEKEKPKREFKFLWWKIGDRQRLEFKIKWNFGKGKK